MTFIITQNDTFSHKIQRSEFIGFVYYVSNPEDVKSILSEHLITYQDATHNCYAYCLGDNQDIQYYSDQGEPSGTAGKPILNAILHESLTNVLIIVTRYFGGVKLGIRGLIDAYHSTALQVIQKVNKIPFIRFETFMIRCGYAQFDALKHSLSQFEIVYIDIVYQDVVTFIMRVTANHSLQVKTILMELSSKGLLELIP